MEDVSANRDNNRGNMYELGNEKLTSSKAGSAAPFFMRPSSSLKDHSAPKGQGMSKNLNKMTDTHPNKKPQMQLPVNTARPPVGEGARIVPGPRVPRRGTTGCTGRRSKARRQSGAAVMDIHEQGDFINKLNKHMLERTDSIRLFRVHKELLSELEGAKAKHVPTPESLEYESNPAGPPEPRKSGQIMRIYRRKPRRLSGDATKGSTIDNLKTNMPSLLERENSVYQIQKRIPSRRSSTTF